MTLVSISDAESNHSSYYKNRKNRLYRHRKQYPFPWTDIDTVTYMFILLSICDKVWSFITCTYTFQLLQAPVLHNLPATVYVGEAETDSRVLYFYSITDPNGDSFTCDNTIDGELAGTAVADNDDEFLLKYNTETGSKIFFSYMISSFNLSLIYDRLFSLTIKWRNDIITLFLSGN